MQKHHQKLVDLIKNYLETFQILELQLNVPIITVFLIISIFAFLYSPQLIVNSDRSNQLIYYLIIPVLFYGLLFYFVMWRTEKLNNYLRPALQVEISSQKVRRGRITRSLIIMMMLLTSFGFFDSFAWWLNGSQWEMDGLRLAILSFFIFIALGFVLLLNLRAPSVISRSVFIVISFIVLGFVDSPENTIHGRSLFLQIIPIFLSSFLISPTACLVTTIGSITLLSYLSISYGIAINSIAYLGLIFLSLIIFIITLQWENALREVEFTNLNLENQVEERTSQLSQANSFKSKFLAQISHELQSPMIAFSIFLRKIQHLIDMEEHQALTNETYRVLEMTKSISTVAKIELDLLNSRKFPRKINLSNLLCKQYLIMKLIAEEKGVALLFSPISIDRYIYAYPDFLSRILQNLLENAIKYTEMGKSIRINQEIGISHYSIHISDSGIGIPADELPSILNRFTRASNVGNIPGTGLGLAMVKEMVEAMDGTITIASTLGKGTTVTVTFPLAE